MKTISISYHAKISRTSTFLMTTALLLGLMAPTKAQETIGGGTITSPAVGPAPSYGLGGSGMVLVKNWHFGTNGTIKNYADMSANFYYHDNHGTVNNGGNYGSKTVSPDYANSIGGQPIESVDSAPVRQFFSDSLRTYITPLDGATTVQARNNNAGNGSFMAKWRLPNGGSLLGRDVVWETRVRYVTPPYFWFALWTDGNKWLWDGNAQGAEHDLVESFGYDNGGGYTNFDGRYWHSNSVATPSKDTVDYNNGWTTPMANHGFAIFDATQYHIWTWVYKRDNTFAMYCDGNFVQGGSNYYWTYGNQAGEEPINMAFKFDAGFGHNQIGSVGYPLAASGLVGKYFEFNYSRVYLSADNETVKNGPHTLPGTVQAADYDTGGQGVAYNQTANGGQTGFRTDNSSADFGNGLGWTSGGQWYKYTVQVPTAGRYQFSFQVASPTGGGTFHVEDENGVNLTGTVTSPNTGSWNAVGSVASSASGTLSAGTHILKWVQDSGGYNLMNMTANQVSGPTATFVKFDTTTEGSWKGVYGADGYSIAADSASQPSYGSASTSAWTYAWASSTSDSRGLQKGGSTDRIAAQWGGDPTYDIDCNLTDSNTHRVSLYGLDWDFNGRSADIQVLDATTGAALDTQNLNDYVYGIYAVWNIKGHVIFRLKNTSPWTNLALAGIFFDPASSAGAVIANYSFETPNEGSSYAYNPTGGSWTFSTGSGIAGAGSAWGNPAAPDGVQVAFLQMTGTISQSVNFTAGSHTISFCSSQRPNYNHGGQDFQVLVDTTVVGTFKPTTTTFANFTTNAITLTAGAHTIQFKGLNTATGDNTAFIDKVIAN